MASAIHLWSLSQAAIYMLSSLYQSIACYMTCVAHGPIREYRLVQHTLQQGSPSVYQALEKADLLNERAA